MEKVLAGKYELREKIGEGSSGIVYLGWDRNLERLVAMKSEKVLSSPAASGTLHQEMEMLRKLEHPMLPALYDYFWEDGQYLVMEYIQGDSLHNIIKREGGIAEEQACKWAFQLLDLLSYLHTRKPPVIYRDLKPQNIIVCPDGNLRVVDFGTAFSFPYDKPGREMMAGTVGYAAPEQLGKEGVIDAKVDERSDIYTFGATLYYMLTGFDPSMPPYGIRPVRCMNPELTAGIEWIVGKCTEAEPSKRYQSAEEVKKDLEHKGAVSRRRRFPGYKRGSSYVVRKIEKKIWLTDKKTTGLIGLGMLLFLLLFKGLAVSGEGMGAPLPVIVYNTQGQKLVIRYDSIYMPEGSLVFELGQELFEKGSMQELSVSLTDCITGERRERVFYLAGKLVK